MWIECQMQTEWRRLGNGEEGEGGNPNFQLNLNVDLGTVKSHLRRVIQQTRNGWSNAFPTDRAPDPRDPNKVKRPPGRGVGLPREGGGGGGLRGPYKPPPRPM